MPDFSATFTSGTTLEPWTDPADGSRPTRLNPITNREHKRRVGTVGVQIEVKATVGGVLAPLDAALGGRLFLGMMAEHPGLPVAITPVALQSSIQRFTPVQVGHYCFVLRRDAGGGLFMHVDVEAAP
jgi:hypothetical protein